MKKLRRVFALLLLVSSFLLASQSSVFAMSGPTGLNQIRTEAGPGAGQITINWQRYNSDITGYLIRYGTSAGKYQYAADNIGNIATYTIGYLTPGVRYYFRLYPYRNGQLSDPLSPEFSDVAMSTPRMVIGTSGPYGQRNLRAVAGPGAGQVTLNWVRFYADVDNYHVTYGLKPGTYIYGAQNIGAASNGLNTFVVGHLTPGVRYYFSIVPSRSGQALYDSAEVSQVAHR